MISSLTPEIIYEDKDIIVCHKPAGVPTQSSRIGTKDMVSILKNHLIKKDYIDCFMDEAIHNTDDAIKKQIDNCRFKI